MLLKTPKGMFLLEKNFRDAYKEDAFVEKYLEEVFDKDLYIVGDISDGILRLKGFDTDPKSPSHYSNLNKYIDASTVIGCPFYVLKRIRSNEEFEKLASDENKSKTDENGFVINALVKENFDKESLKLQSSGKGKPSIVLNIEKINSIPKGELPIDLKENKETKESTKPQEEAQTYVSSSPDFDPSKKEVRNRGNNQNRGQNTNNKNNQNNQNSQNNQNNYNAQKSHKKKNKGFKPRGNNNTSR
ncbi:MAG: DUF1027 domain-containing protein [Acholeplasmatales bacterium]|nr:DUF1027 domain-containing protein [Acholeplasmatales bacterium]